MCYHLTLGCKSDIDKWGIQWPATAAGITSTYKCYMSQGMHVHMYSCMYLGNYVYYMYHLATRLCIENSEWSVPSVDDCQTEAYKLLESRVMESINATTLIEYTSELSNLTNTQLCILPQDIITASNTVFWI